MATKAPKMNKGKTVKVVKTGEVGKITAVRNEGRGDWFDVNLSTDPKKKQIKSFRAAALELVV